MKKSKNYPKVPKDPIRDLKNLYQALGRAIKGLKEAKRTLEAALTAT